MNDLKSCYELLGLQPGASPEEVRHRFRELVLRCHPDRFTGDPSRQRHAAEEFRLVTEAHRRIVAGQGAASAGGYAPAVRGASAGVALARFLGEWPNLLFIALGATSLVLAAGRYGTARQALLHMLEIVLVPSLFAIAWNVAARGPGTIRRLYIGFTLCAALVALVEASLSPREREVGGWPGAPAGFSGEAGGSAPRAGGEGALSRSPFAAEGGGGTVPAAPPAPRAPLAPAAPMAPVAPLVPAAPLAPTVGR